MLQRLKAHLDDPALPIKGELGRFVIYGAINTVISCAAYLLLLQITSSTIAFAVAFMIGTIGSALFHSRMTFRVLLTPLSCALSASYYLTAYVINAAILQASITVFGIEKHWAILPVVAASVLISFVVNRTIFKRNTRRGTSDLRG